MKHYGLSIAEGSEVTNLTVPTGTSFPANDNVGEFFFRTDLNILYVRDNSEWVEVGGSTPTNYIVDNFVGTGSQTDFTASTSIPTDGAVLITFDGVVQHVTEYSVSGTNISFTEAVPIDVAIEALHLGSTTVDLFSGTGAQTVFTLSQPVSADTVIIVSVSGVTQHLDAYTVIGDVLTFSEAILVGTDNIQVTHLQIVASNAGGNFTVENFTSNGLLSTFTTTTDIEVDSSIMVTIDGVVQYLNDSYTISNNDIIFATAPGVSFTNNIEVKFLGAPLDIGTPSDGSVSYSKLNVAMQGAIFRKNVIINGGFDIWQRGTSFPINSGVQYTTDRWVGVTSHASAFGSVSKISDNPNGAKLQRDNGSTAEHSYVLATVIESDNMKRLAGKSVTLSLDLKIGANFSSPNILIQANTGTVADEGVSGSLSGSWTGFDQNIMAITTATTSWQTFEFTTILNSDALELTINISFDTTGTAGADDSISIRNVQLEKGSIATEFEHTQIGEELALCQRYYEVGDNGHFYYLTNNSGSQIQRQHVNYKIVKRVLGTIVFNNVSGSGTANGTDAPTRHGFQTTFAGNLADLSVYTWTADAEL